MVSNFKQTDASTMHVPVQNGREGNVHSVPCYDDVLARGTGPYYVQPPGSRIVPNQLPCSVPYQFLVSDWSQLRNSLKHSLNLIYLQIFDTLFSIYESKHDNRKLNHS